MNQHHEALRSVVRQQRIEVTIDPFVLETITRWLWAWFPVR